MGDVVIGEVHLQEGLGVWSEIGDNVTTGSVASSSISTGTLNVGGENINSILEGKAEVSHSHTWTYYDKWWCVSGHSGLNPDYGFLGVVSSGQLRFRKSANGIVTMFFSLNAPDGGVIFVMPHGYRPILPAHGRLWGSSSIGAVVKVSHVSGEVSIEPISGTHCQITSAFFAYPTSATTETITVE